VSIYRGQRWVRTRALALRRAGYRCQRCGTRDTDARPLVVHHRDALGMVGHRAHELANLDVLCRPCHGREHGMLPPRD